MKSTLLSVVTAIAIVAEAAVPQAQKSQKAIDAKETGRVREAITVLNEVMGADDSAIPRDLLQKAEAIAVFPSLVKAGFVVGGQHGRGIISARDPKTGAWSSPAFLTVTGGSFGLQIGAQAVDLVLVVQNRRGLDNLLNNQFKIGADASVAAGPRRLGQHRHPDARADPQLLAHARHLRGHHAQRQHHPPGPRRQRTLLRRGLPHARDRGRPRGRIAGADG